MCTHTLANKNFKPIFMHKQSFNFIFSKLLSLIYIFPLIGKHHSVNLCNVLIFFLLLGFADERTQISF